MSHRKQNSSLSELIDIAGQFGRWISKVDTAPRGPKEDQNSDLLLLAIYLKRIKALQEGLSEARKANTELQDKIYRVVGRLNVAIDRYEAANQVQLKRFDESDLEEAVAMACHIIEDLVPQNHEILASLADLSSRVVDLEGLVHQPKAAPRKKKAAAKKTAKKTSH